MAKYVQPTFDVYGVAKFFNQITLDASIFLRSPASTSVLDTPNALVIDSTGADQELKIRALGSMAWETASNYALASDLADVSTRLDTAETDITTIEGDITQLGTDIGDVSTRVQTNEGDIVQLGTDIGDVSTRLDTAETDITTIEGDITQLGTDIGDVSTRVNTNEGDIVQLGTDIGDVSTRLNTAESDITTIEGDITQLGTDIGDVSTRVQTNEGDITQLGTDVGDVSTRVQTNEGDIVQLGTDIGDVSTRVDTLEGDLGNYVLKAGDTMTGPLTISNGGLVVSNDVSISGDTLVSGDLIVSTDAFVGGNLTVDGSLYVVNQETIDVSAAFIHLNTGLTGTPPATMQSGMVVGRGDEEPYVFIFDETLDTFRIGIAAETSTGYLDSSTQAVATREDSPESWGIGYWNGNLFMIETSAGFTFEPGVGLSLPIATDQGSEQTVLSIQSGLVGSVELGTMAFADAANFALASDVADVSTRLNTAEGDITQLGTDIGDVSTRVNTNEGDIVQLGTDIGDVSTRLNTAEGEITQLGTDIGDVSTRVNTNEGDIVQLGTDVGDVSTRVSTIETDFIDTVTNTTGVVGGHGVFAQEVNNTVYLKQLVEGSGTTITSDASTISISVTSAEGYAEKYVGTFNADGSTSHTIPDASLGFTSTGPFHVTVYENSEIVYTGVNTNGTDTVLSWTTGALSGTCSVIITG